MFGPSIVRLSISIILLPATFPLAVRAAEPLAVSREITALIQQAGDADDDADRLAILKRLRQRQNLGKSLEADLDKLIGQIGRWVHGKHLGYFGRSMYKDGDFDLGIAQGSPLYSLTYLYRGRMLVWAVMGFGAWGDACRCLQNARGFFEEYTKAFPKNRIARMYLGEPIPPDRTYPDTPGAPDWAVHQRECLERLADIIEWWIDHRMQPNGEFGGGWGDDCEMWRSWVPVLIGFDSPKISGAQAKFSEALMSQPHMRLGYTAHMYDVEHTAEDSADAITPMMHIEPNNTVWSRRALRLAELMETVWTGRNERGFLQFKSTYINAEKVDTDPNRACDTVYHPRAVQPTLLYWQRTGDERLTRLFSAWMDTWVDATARSERGKPAGIIPSAIHWPDGKVGGLAPDWWDPKNHGEYALYRWPSAMKSMVQTMLLTHHMTGQAEYLGPIRSMVKARLKYLRDPVSNPAPGSELWCASEMAFLAEAASKYRLLTGSEEFDELLARDMSPYMWLRLRGERGRLCKALQRSAEALRINFPGYTSEVRYTDRLLRFPSLFAENGFRVKPPPSVGVPDTSLLYSSATGDPGGVGYFPLNAVRWLTPPRDIAALVTDSGKDRFTAELFHFGKDTRALAAELYLLARGDYRLTLAPADGRSVPLSSRAITVKGPYTRVSLDLPPQRLCTLNITHR